MTQRHTKHGFTLLELMISVFIFAIVVMVVSGIFGRGIVAYRYADAIQKGLEEAQFAGAQIAKTLRTSSVVSSSPTTITVYDASQGKCVIYAIANDIITQRVASSTADPLNRCGGVSYSTATPMTSPTNGKITGKFAATPSVLSPARVGKVSMVFIVTAPNNSTSMSIQSSVSLRDYTKSGLL